MIKFSPIAIPRKLLVLGFFAGVSFFGSAQTVVFQNFDGFLSIGTQSNRTAGISLADMDNDGDLDALVANGRHWAEQNYLFYNDGKGNFKQGQPIGLMDASYEMVAADVNQDGYMDLLVANDNIPNALYFGGKGQEFTWQGSFGAIAPTRGIRLVDLDNDSDLDIVLAHRNAPNEICWNDGSGSFDTCITFGAEKDPTIQIAIADINRDGYLDLVTAERKSVNFIYFGKENRAFEEPFAFGRKTDDSRSVALHDIDRDGFIDIIIGNLGTPNQIYYGDSESKFTRTYAFETSRMTASVAVADFNKDGWPDLVFGNAEDVNYVQLGSESGTFSEIALNKDLKEDTYKVITGDLNGDGLPDIVEANSGVWNLIYRTRIRE